MTAPRGEIVDSENNVMRLHRNVVAESALGIPSTVRCGPAVTLVLAITVVASVAAPNVGLAGDPPLSGDSAAAARKVNPDGWTSSAVCGECHQAIHAVWRHSLHARSWSNGIFQAGYKRSLDAHGAEKSRACLMCHTPTVRHGEDYAVKQEITAEGITCDFCHSVSAIELGDGADPFRLAVGKTKYGPLRHAQSPAHEIVDTKLHKNSEFCAGCHEYRTSNGIAVLATYSEWKSSPYAKRGQQCQDCHMPLVPGRVVALDVKQDSGKVVNLHDVSGSHDIDRVRKAVTLELFGYEWLGDRIWVYIQVANEGSGHCFPTGLPMHRALLEVEIHDGSTLVDRREIPFEIVMLDSDRRVLKREHEVFLNAAYIRSDTRLKPAEKRMIDISFRSIEATKLVLTAKLTYAYSTETLVSENGEQRIEPVEMEFLIASRQNTMKPLGN